jgi:hypothetical protein
MDRLGSLGRLCVALSIVTALAVIATEIGDHRYIVSHAATMAEFACVQSSGDLHTVCTEHQADYYVSEAAVRELTLSFLAIFLPVVIWAAVLLVGSEERGKQG